MKNLRNINAHKVKKGIIGMVLFFPLFLFSSCDVLQAVLGGYTGTGGLTNAEIVAGLKEALKEGAKFAANNASQKDGFLKNSLIDIRILMPDELRRVEKNIRRIPLVGDKVVDDFVEAMNRGAEKAAKEAAPVFVNAITSMTINDAVGILKGDSTAATAYLERTTSSQLAAKFQPIIKNALSEVGATRYYNALQDAINTYNKTPLVNKINVNVRELPVLEEYATDKAIEGLFRLVALEEKKIREDPFGQSKEIIRKVFGSLKNQVRLGEIGKPGS